MPALLDDRTLGDWHTVDQMASWVGLPGFALSGVLYAGAYRPANGCRVLEIEQLNDEDAKEARSRGCRGARVYRLTVMWKQAGWSLLVGGDELLYSHHNATYGRHFVRHGAGYNPKYWNRGYGDD